ncbi:hypothetical protein HMPREF1404_01001 [Helicobacter pylori GAM210Bi]|nr:hypothetical protein HMPREF1404_01001 [Helicobacter pylori GAM210Bi]
MLGFGVIAGGYLKNEMTNYETISHSFNGSRNATTLKFQHKLKILPAFSLCIFFVSHKNKTLSISNENRAKSYIFVF